MRVVLASLALLASSLAAGCVSNLHMPAKELAKLEPGEGRVFGSIEVVVAPAEVEAPRVRAGGLLHAVGVVDLLTADAAGVDFTVQFRRWVGSATRGLELRPGAPRAYAARLKEGEYRVIVTCSQMNGELELAPPFFVVPGETTYLGRLQVLVPAVVGDPATAPVIGGQAVTRRDEDLALLGDEYRAVLPEPVERVIGGPLAPRKWSGGLAP